MTDHFEFDSNTPRVEWIAPDAGLLAAVLELQEYTSPTLRAKYGEDEDVIEFLLLYPIEQYGQLPEALEVVNDSNSPGDCITGIVREMDEYVPGWAEPPGFSYHAGDTFGKMYATYGSAFHQQKLFTFTIRAYNRDLIGDLLDSNTDFESWPEHLYEDREFSILVLNNYSSDRDRYLVREFTAEKQIENGKLMIDGVEYETAEEFILALKALGYYG